MNPVAAAAAAVRHLTSPTEKNQLPRTARKFRDASTARRSGRRRRRSSNECAIAAATRIMHGFEEASCRCGCRSGAAKAVGASPVRPSGRRGATSGALADRTTSLRSVELLRRLRRFVCVADGDEPHRRGPDRQRQRFLKQMTVSRCCV